MCGVVYEKLLNSGNDTKKPNRSFVLGLKPVNKYRYHLYIAVSIILCNFLYFIFYDPIFLPYYFFFSIPLALLFVAAIHSSIKYGIFFTFMLKEGGARRIYNYKKYSSFSYYFALLVASLLFLIFTFSLNFHRYSQIPKRRLIIGEKVIITKWAGIKRIKNKYVSMSPGKTGQVMQSKMGNKGLYYVKWDAQFWRELSLDDRELGLEPFTSDIYIDYLLNDNNTRR